MTAYNNYSSFYPKDDLHGFCNTIRLGYYGPYGACISLEINVCKGIMLRYIFIHIENRSREDHTWIIRPLLQDQIATGSKLYSGEVTKYRFVFSRFMTGVDHGLMRP